jgi:phosphate-selective porin OprO/OprP
VAAGNQFKIAQWVQELAFKYRGFSFQQEYHRKNVIDRVEGTENDMSGLYVQSGYFFHNLYEGFPAPLELAARYAYVEEPNTADRSVNNERKEYTLGLNWFFSSHNNKVTLDYSHLTIDDGLVGINDSDDRVRLQWDVSF